MQRKCALLSTHDKTGIIEFATQLSECGFDILSTGGTARTLKAAGIQVIDVEQFTGDKEILGGRVKTLHPRIHAGLLYDEQLHREGLPAGYRTIDLVAVTLYPFAQAVAQNLDEAQSIELIDIGGPTMLRAAAKNFNRVIAVCDPADYPAVIAQLRAGKNDRAFRRELALKAFALTANYDQMITQHFAQTKQSTKTLRYGENPHQTALLTSAPDIVEPVAYQVLQGKELSYNNMLDLDAALAIVEEFETPTCVIIKHQNPCGVSTGTTESIETIVQKALDVDRTSAFGGIVAVNRTLNVATTKLLTEIFIECVVAPGIDQAALDLLAAKKNLRVVIRPVQKMTNVRYELRATRFGVLKQQPDTSNPSTQDWRCVTLKQTQPLALNDLQMAYRVVKHCKSNAIVLAKNLTVLGMGCGKVSRVDATEFAIQKATSTFGAQALKGAVAASDAFFPFADNLELLATAGITDIVQPGGSVRDQEVIDAANKHGISMQFTGTRHFKH